MQPVSSVTAFLARHLSRPTVDAEAQEILALLDPIQRRVAEELARTPQREDRLRHLAEETGTRWEPARYDRIERARCSTSATNSHAAAGCNRSLTASSSSTR